MNLQKVICPQCGSNEIKVVSASVFECESCGTILKEEQPQVVIKEVVNEAVTPKKKEKPFRSKRIQHGLDDQPDFGHDPEDHHEAGNQFMKLIFWTAILGGAAMLVVWLLE